MKSVGSIEWICLTCDSNLKRGRLPCCAKANKMSFPVTSDVLELTWLEERLVAPRICFMQLRELPRGGQLKISGGVVNVPANVNSTMYYLSSTIIERVIYSADKVKETSWPIPAKYFSGHCHVQAISCLDFYPSINLVN